MAILFYQMFIVFTLLITRLIAPRKLVLAALLWTALTVVNLFYPPLIILQLAVIWITFGLLNPNQKHTAGSQQ